MHNFSFHMFVGVILLNGVAGAACPPTPAMSSGTHYKPVTVKKIDIGQGLKVSGRILQAGTCKAIAGAKIAHWQAGKDGYYSDDLRAYLHSGDDGTYAFNTEWPAAVVPHIHFIVSAPGYRTLTTQWVGGSVVDRIEFDMVLEPENRN